MGVTVFALLGLVGYPMRCECHGFWVSRFFLTVFARERKNTFESLMDAAKDCSLGSMSHALYEVGGEYRRNM